MNNTGVETNMEIISQLNETQKIAFLKAFVRLAKSDGNFDESEKEFIKRIAKSYSIDEKHHNSIINVNTDEEIIEAVKSINNRKAALELIKEMCMLAHADDELSDSETLLIGKIGTAMGVELEKIEQISNWIIDRIIWLEEAKLIFEEVT